MMHPTPVNSGCAVMNLNLDQLARISYLHFFHYPPKSLPSSWLGLKCIEKRVEVVVGECVKFTSDVPSIELAVAGIRHTHSHPELTGMGCIEKRIEKVCVFVSDASHLSQLGVCA